MGSFLIEEEAALEHPVDVPVARRYHSSRSRTSEAEQVVEFVIGDERFAVDLFDTREEINTPEVTPIPNAPVFITGMIDLRGVITTIIDLGEMMHISRNLPEKKLMGYRS
jgi:purine-binding chemotaxis protein CheW